jgi:hypothetical protein
MPSSLITGSRRGQNRETLRQIIPLLAAIDDRVDHPMSKEKLRRVGPFGQFATDDLLCHAGTREANQGAGFGEASASSDQTVH